MSKTQTLWQPTQDRIDRSQMYAFMLRVAKQFDVAPNYPALHAWSIEHREQFWSEMLTFAEINPTTPAKQTCTGEGMLHTKWFPGMTLNFAEHLLRFDDDRIAIAAEDERGRSRIITYAQLRSEVAKFAAGLKNAGVVSGDRVVGFLPNIPEAIIAMLAAASIGAVWSSCSPDFGIGGVLDRFGQIKPKVLVAADAYSYNGKSIDCLEKVRGIVEKIPSIEQVVIVPFIADSPDLSSVPGAKVWSQFTIETSELIFAPHAFDHPLYIMYSSGTTGVPKCIVHGAGGTLLQHMKELMLHCDLRRDDTIFYFTTCGWMMWNWLVSSLGVGATVVLYEGSPFHPDPHQMWAMIERLGITIFGTSPKFIAACENVDLHPKKEHDVSKLRAVLSTGSPLTPENFVWVYQEVKKDIQLSSICGGTDIISCFILGNPILPVRSGEIQCVGLGMDVQAFGDNGTSVIGEKGELVCCSPFPSQPVGFWNDPDGEKYRSAYFDHYPDRSPDPDRDHHSGIWRHGDFIEITQAGGVIVYGRSDATLNPGGVRIGTAEIYRQVESLEEIADSVVVGKHTEDADIEICLFVVLNEGASLDDALVAKIKTAIIAGATKRHVPKHIKKVTAIPYTISGKKVEIAVTRMIHGEDVPNKDALSNPDALDQYANIL